MVGSTTDAKQFRAFIRQLKDTVRPELAGKKFMPVLLLDNASAHKAHLSTNVLEQKFTPLFQPAYS